MSDDVGGGNDSGGCDSGGGDYSCSAQTDNDYSGIGSTTSAVESAIEAVHQIESTKDAIDTSDAAAVSGQSQDSNDYQQGHMQADTYNPLYLNDTYHGSQYVSNNSSWRGPGYYGRRDNGSSLILKVVICVTLAIIVVFILLFNRS